MILEKYKDYITYIKEEETIDNYIYTIRLKESISEDFLLTFLNDVYALENNVEENKKRILIFLQLKNLNFNLKKLAIKDALQKDDLNNPLLLLNIISIIKIDNELDDEFFNHENIYFNSIEDIIDIKDELKNEIKQFKRKLSLYFLSLIKSYSKLTITPLDNVIELPKTYSNIILSLDFFTLSGIFSSSPNIDTAECIYIKNAQMYIQTLLNKNLLSMKFFEDFNKSGTENNANFTK